jgi:hypothetical protein
MIRGKGGKHKKLENVEAQIDQISISMVEEKNKIHKVTSMSTEV